MSSISVTADDFRKGLLREASNCLGNGYSDKGPAPTRLLVSPDASSPIMICLLGGFQLLNGSEPLTLRRGGKTEGLLVFLAIQRRHRALRETLLHSLWPDSDVSLANRALHSLIYSLNKLVGTVINGIEPVLYDDGYYRLNVEAGIGVDVASFDALANVGDQMYSAGELAAAIDAYDRATDLYRGDMCIDTIADVQAIMECERLRARYLTLQARLADYHFNLHHLTESLHYAWRLLECDPCREDAHRLMMQCYVRRGERAEALRHYRKCVDILHTEFNAEPEVATSALFEQIRLNPSSI